MEMIETVSLGLETLRASIQGTVALPGVVTGSEIQLFPVTTVYGGNLVYPIEAAREVFMRYRTWMASAPDELTSSIIIMNYPPIPRIPEFLRGLSAVIVRGCYVGPMEEGAKLVQQWRDWMPPMLDQFGEMPFTDVATISNDPIPGKSTSVWLRNLDDETIDILIRYGVTHNGLVVTEVRHVGGAVAKVDGSANAYGSRDASLLRGLIGFTPTPEDMHHLEEYTDQIKRELHTHVTGAVYINFLERSERQERTRQAYSQALRASDHAQGTV